MYGNSTSHIDNEVDTNIRAADSDREATAERLRHHHAAGRIDLDEFQQRLDRCYQAKTTGQLQQLVADLPRDPQRAPREFGRRRLFPLVPILVAILAVTVLTGGHGGFLFVFLGFLLVRRFLLPRWGWSFRGPRAGAGRPQA